LDSVAQSPREMWICQSDFSRYEMEKLFTHENEALPTIEVVVAEDGESGRDVSLIGLSQ